MIIIALLISICSCDKKNETDLGTFPKPDNSLSGLVKLIKGYKILEAGASFENVVLEELDQFSSLFTVTQCDENIISIHCFSDWKYYNIKIKVGCFEIEGQRSHVKFDQKLSDVSVIINKTEYESVPCTITGWIKEQSGTNENTEITRDTESLPTRPEVLCD